VSRAGDGKDPLRQVAFAAKLADKGHVTRRRHDSSLRDGAARRVRVLTAVAGAGSIAGTGALLVAVPGVGTAVATSPVVAAQPPAVTHPVPSSLLTSKRVARRHHAALAGKHARPATHTSAATTHTTVTRHTAPAVVKRPAPAPAATSSPAPQPQPTSSSGSTTHSGGSH